MKTLKRVIIKYLTIIIGALIYAVGTVFFVNPHNLAPGGLTGFAIVVNRAISQIFGVDVKIGVIVFILNVPLMAAGLWKFGKSFLAGTIFGTIALSLQIYGLEALYKYLETTVNASAEGAWFIIENDMTAALTGGGLMAVGLGTVFKAGATTGGTDIIVKLLKLKFRHLATGRIFLIIDTTIVLSSLPVVGWQIERILYSFVGMIMCSLVLDLVLYGKDGAKLVYVVSDKTPEIAQKLLKELSLGATILDGIGAYSGVKKEVIMCVVKKVAYPRLKDLVSEIDPHAFLIVSSASEVYGIGYKNSFKQDI